MGFRLHLQVSCGLNPIYIIFTDPLSRHFWYRGYLLACVSRIRRLSRPLVARTTHNNKPQVIQIHWIPRRDWKRLKGCVFSPPSLCLVPARGREARKHNLSIASLPIPLRPIFYLPDGSSELEIFLHKFFGQKKYVLVYYIFCVRCSVQVKEPLPTEFYDKHVHSPLQSVQSYTFFTESRPLVAI